VDGGGSVPGRTANQQAVVEELLAGRARTRSQLAHAIGLSKPTVHAIVGLLVEEGLVEEVGQTDGTVGRSATLFRVQPTARAAIGIDLGGTKVLAAIADLAGNLRAERRIETGAGSSEDLLGRLMDLCRGLADEAEIPWNTVGSLAIGCPGVPDPVTGYLKLAGNIPALAEVDLAAELRTRSGKEVILENDVNMAVLGERWKGLAQRTSDAVFIGIGTGIGMGVISQGQLQRGATGAAGEIGFLPLGADPFDAGVQSLGPLEEVLSARGVMATYRRHRAGTGDPTLADAREVFEAGTASLNEAARQTVEHVCDHLALTIAAVHAVLDPERVILGGGIGSNPVLLRGVRSRLDRLGRRPASVDVSALGQRAALVGALSEAVHRIRQQVVENPPPPDHPHRTEKGLVPADTHRP
jgi:glucokinase